MFFLKSAHKKLRHCVAIFVLFLLTTIPLHAVTNGVVKDYNPTTGDLTIMTPTPGFFMPGQSLVVYRLKIKLGNARAGISWHTKINAKMEKNSFKDIRKGDLVFSSDTLALQQTQSKEIQTVNFAKISTPASRFTTIVTFPSHPTAEAQTRPLKLSRTLAYRVEGEEFYRSVDSSQLTKIRFLWIAGKLSGEMIQLRGEVEQPVLEIVAGDILENLKPPSEFRKDTVMIDISIQKELSAFKNPVDGVGFEITFDTIKELLEKCPCLLKSYSEGIFLGEIPIDNFQERMDPITAKLYVPASELKTGLLKISIFLVPAYKSGTEYFAKEEGQLIAEKEIEFSEFNPLWDLIWKDGEWVGNLPQ